MKNPSSLKITVLFLGLSLSSILTIAIPINDNQIFDVPKEISAIRTVHNDHSLSPLPYPPTSLSPRSLKGWTYRILTTHVLLPTKTTALSLSLSILTHKINSTMHQWMAYITTINSYVPSSHIKL